MTGKKKVGILATLALCVTVGGVYATWMYADTSAAIESQHKHLAQDLAGSTTTGAVGTLKVETAGLKFVIDQASDAHDAKLVWRIRRRRNRSPSRLCPAQRQAT
ncbi:MAG: hypothetical protein E7357_05875 [Clostridiales bacterium]|nr:hypothetical protein [Clostridiales bacterium]